MDIVSVGDIVDVWILDIDERKRKVSLTMIDQMDNNDLQYLTEKISSTYFDRNLNIKHILIID